MQSSRPATYQVRNTSYYQTLMRKTSVQLQRLRDEYEQIQEINDRTIEKRMRQLRLSRLFREIERIKSRSATAMLHRQRPLEKTSTQIRAEQLAEARNLGKKYSEFNGMHRSHYLLRTLSKEARGDRIKSKEKIQRRINYGNQMSDENRLKVDDIPPIPRRRQVMAGGVLRNVSSMELHKHKLLKSRLDYGNSRSFINCKRTAERRARRSFILKSVSRLDNSRRSSVAEQLSSNSSPNESNTLLNVQTYYTPSHATLTTKAGKARGPKTATADGTDVAPKPEINHERALANWAKLRDHLIRLSDEARWLSLSDYEDSDDVADDEEYCLRKICNDVDLPNSQINCNTSRLECALVNEEDAANGDEEAEMLLNIESYIEGDGLVAAMTNDETHSVAFDTEAPVSIPFPELLKKFETLKLVTEQQPEMLETCVPVNKKSSESKVNTLRTIFETKK